MEPRIRRFFATLLETRAPLTPAAAIDGPAGQRMPEAAGGVDVRAGLAGGLLGGRIEALAREWGVSPLEAGLRLLESAPGEPLPERGEPVASAPGRRAGRGAEALGLRLDPAVLDPRGLEPETCLVREIGVVAEPDHPRFGWLAVAVFDIVGQRVGWTFRRVEPAAESAPLARPRPGRRARPARWSVSAGFPAGRHLYNLDRAWPSVMASETAIVVEGPFDALHLHRAGWPNTVALLGNRLTGWHVDLLLTVGAARVVLFFDNDHGGRLGRRWALHTDGRLDQFQVVDLSNALPPGHDPDDLPADRLETLLAPYRPLPSPP